MYIPCPDAIKSLDAVALPSASAFCVVLILPLLTQTKVEALFSSASSAHERARPNVPLILASSEVRTLLSIRRVCFDCNVPLFTPASCPALLSAFSPSKCRSVSPVADTSWSTPSVLAVAEVEVCALIVPSLLISFSAT